MQHEDQVADGLAEIDGAAVDRRQQQAVQAAAVFFDGHRAVQAQRAGEGKGHPQHAGGDRGARAGVQLEGEVKDQDHQQREDQHRREQLAAAQLGGQVFPDHGAQGAQDTPLGPDTGASSVEMLDSGQILR